MTERRYKAPPIVEAAIEIRFRVMISPEDLDAGSEALAPHYPHQETVRNIELLVSHALDATAPPLVRTSRNDGRRRTMAETGEVVMLLPQALVVAQLAPYPGWDRLFSRFCRDWRLWADRVHTGDITNIALRYINRLDIPMIDNIIDESQYLRVYPAYPAVDFGPLVKFGVYLQFPADREGLQVTLNTTNVASPVVDHASIILDQTVSMTPGSDQSEEALHRHLGRMRERKNTVFESCITDRARELFQT